MGVEIKLLGPPRVRREGEAVTFDTRKATALLAHLALADRPRSRGALCELLWPELEPDRARGALRRTLSTVRRAIGDEWIDTAADSVALRRGPGLELDVVRFRALAAGDGSIEELTEAARICSGAFLEGFSLRDSPEFDLWKASEEGALRRELGTLLDRLVDALDASGDYQRAVPLARRWLALDPLHEPAHRALIRLLALSGERAAALSQYRECVRTLSQELGVAPVEETAALFEQVSEGELRPSLQRKTERPAAAAGPPPGELPLVGRDRHLERLTQAYDALADDGGLAVVEGEAGIGKTRLAAELCAEVRDRGAVVLEARCHDDEAGLPYGAVLELLREALDRSGWRDDVAPQRLADASLLRPELASEDLPPPMSLDGPGARARLLDAVAEVLTAASAGTVPGVLLVDDVQAADEATLDTIAYLGRRLRGRRLMLIVCWRSEGVPPGHRLRRLAVDLAREGGATVVSLGRLGEAEVGQLARAARAGQTDGELERRVYLESEGLPLFVAEYLAALAGGAPAEDELPGEVRSLLGARLSGLGSIARQVLSAAAVIGRSFDLRTVREASGRGDEETVDAIEELTRQGIVRELPGSEPAYDFSHQKLRALVYEETALARRRLLHARVGAALASGGDQRQAARVAQHLRLAGDGTGAADQYRLAAGQAEAVLAHADALEHLDAALALEGPSPDLHERIGDLRTLVGEYGGALAAYESAAAHSDPGALAQIEHKLGGVHERRGEWERAEARLRAAIEAAPAEDTGLRSRIQADLSLTLHRSGRREAAAELAREALGLAEQAADRRAQAQAHNILGVLARAAGQQGVAGTELERSLALAEELGNLAAQTAALNNLALLRREAGEGDAARELTQRALDLCAARGDRHREAALHNNLADLHHDAGRTQDSMEHLKRAVAIFSEVGADEATRLPEIWKLVSW